MNKYNRIIKQQKELYYRIMEIYKRRFTIYRKKKDE